jgi:CRISPR/Cas system CSM-associated protein Csm3 (group 7 of RAMP superfamily)
MKLEIAVRLFLDSVICVGSGALADSLADKPIVKMADGLPVIPGSTIKGKTRHTCEQLARAVFGQRWVWPACSPPRKFCAKDDLCPVCRIFGTPALRSSLIFSDLILEIKPGSGKLLSRDFAGVTRRTELRTGIGLSRALRTAQEDRLFSLESYRPAKEFCFKGDIEGMVGNRMEAGLLVAGLKFTRAFGGGKSRGMGWACVEPEVRIDGGPVAEDELIREIERWRY